jgi:hypothetical protein
MARRLLLAFAVLAGLAIVTIRLGLVPARPALVWPLALLPIAAVLRGPRSPGLVAWAVLELVSLLPLHAFVTLVRASRLEGG